MIADAVRRVVEGLNLSREEMKFVFGEVMDGSASDVQKAALLTSLRMKGETVDEITGAAEAMRSRVTRLAVQKHPLVDTCGTGGDGRGTFNVSTVASIVASAAGANVAKHGNRAVSSRCGSADLFSGLGVEIDRTPDQTAAILDEIGIAFLFAPRFHPAMKEVAGVRKELGLRTIFNILGPLTNPAFATRQVLGVFSPGLTDTMARVLDHVGTEHALVVHSEDGLDEISISARTRVSELRSGEISTSVIEPEEIGVRRYPIESIAGGDVSTNVAIARSILDGKEGGPREIVCANAGAAIYVAGLARSIREGAVAAREAIDSGAAGRKLDELIEASRRWSLSDV